MMQIWAYKPIYPYEPPTRHLPPVYIKAFAAIMIMHRVEDCWNKHPSRCKQGRELQNQS